MNQSLETVDDVREIVSSLRYADESFENEKLLQKCIQKARIFKDKDLEFNARLAYLNQVNWLNQNDKTIATLPWLLKRIDDGYNLDELSSVLWMYKWVITNLPGFAAIPRNKIEELLEDMSTRFQSFGSGQKVIYYLKLQVYLLLGDLPKSEENYVLYTKSRGRGSLDDCAACQPNNLIDLHLAKKDYAKAIKEGKPLVDKKLTCKIVPSTTYPDMAYAHFLLGNLEEAKEMAFKARRGLPKKTADLSSFSMLVKYYALAREFVKGRNVIEDQLVYTLDHVADSDKCDFYLACLMFFISLEKAGKTKITMKFAKPIGLFVGEEGVCEVGTSIPWLQNEVDSIASKLDIRNGNSYFKNYVLEEVALLDK